MKSQHFQGKPVGNEHSRVCVLFDPANGRVVHGHGVTVLESAKPIEPAELEARARRHALSMGKSVDGLKALHLPLEAIKAHAAFKVNPEGTGIVPLPPGPRHDKRG
jgi:hypothetical protein